MGVSLYLCWAWQYSALSNWNSMYVRMHSPGNCNRESMAIWWHTFECYETSSLLRNKIFSFSFSISFSLSFFFKQRPELFSSYLHLTIARLNDGHDTLAKLRSDAKFSRVLLRRAWSMNPYLFTFLPVSTVYRIFIRMREKYSSISLLKYIETTSLTNNR